MRASLLRLRGSYGPFAWCMGGGKRIDVGAIHVAIAVDVTRLRQREPHHARVVIRRLIGELELACTTSSVGLAKPASTELTSTWSSTCELPSNA